MCILLKILLHNIGPSVCSLNLYNRLLKFVHISDYNVLNGYVVFFRLCSKNVMKHYDFNLH